MLKNLKIEFSNFILIFIIYKIKINYQKLLKKNKNTQKTFIIMIQYI